MGVTWVLQDGAFCSEDMSALRCAIENAGARVVALKLIPFVHKFASPPPDLEGPVICYGSSGLLKAARAHGWHPAGWDGAELDLSNIERLLGSKAMNFGARLCNLHQVPETMRAMGLSYAFVRPNSEHKEFPGMVYSYHDACCWIESLASAGYLEHHTEPFVVAATQKIQHEWRVFIVDGHIVQGCQYAIGGKLHTNPGLPDAVRTFVSLVLQDFRPLACFVIDIAEDAEGALKVIEVNSINSAGFYACDIPAIIHSVTAFVKQNEAGKDVQD